MKKNSLFIIVLALSLSACSQQSKEDFIVGKWIMYKQIDIFGDSTTLEGTPYRLLKKDKVLNFKPKGVFEYTWAVDEPPQVADYEFVNDTLLRLNTVLWTFKIVDKDKFCIGSSHLSFSLKLNPNGSRNYYIRIE